MLDDLCDGDGEISYWQHGRKVSSLFSEYGFGFFGMGTVLYSVFFFFWKMFSAHVLDIPMVLLLPKGKARGRNFVRYILWLGQAIR